MVIYKEASIIGSGLILHPSSVDKLMREIPPTSAGTCTFAGRALVKRATRYLGLQASNVVWSEERPA
jgi:hypothetical protein